MSDSKVKLNSGTSLQAFIRNVVDEGVKSALAQRALSEKERQLKAGAKPDEAGENSGGGEGDDDDLFGGGGDAGDDDSDDDLFGGSDPSKTMASDSEDQGDGEVRTKDAVDRLNTIRSGKSFKDEKVAASFDEYFSSLSKAEKSALMAFLKGIAQIVTGQAMGKQADEPGDDAKVDIEPKPEPEQGKKVKSVKPNIIKGGGKPAGVKGAPAEDTSGPIPITPKRR